MNSESDRRLRHTFPNLPELNPTDSDGLRGTRNLNDFDESEKI